MIDRNSAVPMYEQVALTLRDEIIDGRYGRSGCIGTHTALASRFDVSLITIRKAVSMLAEQGLIDVAQGKGTFVKGATLQDNLTRLTGVENIISESHLTSRVDVRTFEMIDTPEDFAPDLREGFGEKCLHIERTHSMEGACVAYAEIYLPSKYGEKLTQKDIEKFTVYQLYEKRWKMELGTGRQVIHADAASKKTADILGVPEGWPVLSIERRAYSASGELVEYMRLVYEYTKYSFEVELRLSSV